ncbi:hypothetical protein [uncultured Caballeronia sp.]|uniref:hypothetical protein n=1 Tax=uncultured Caballeronia sp. TaxID=1827198 RepID=UPI0035CC3C33
MNDRANLNLNDAGHQARDVDASSTPRAVARGLGWFSITLGLAELLAPRAVSRAAGLDSNPALVRLYGLRELVCGIGILASDKVAPFLWARVGGDVLDIGTIVAHSNTVDRQDRTRAFGAVVNVLGVTALDMYAARGIREEPSNGVTSPMRDYSSRSGFPRPADDMRGVARANFKAPRDMRTPDALRAWTLPKRTDE